MTVPWRCTIKARHVAYIYGRANHATDGGNKRREDVRHGFMRLKFPEALRDGAWLRSMPSIDARRSGGVIDHVRRC